MEQYAETASSGRAGSQRRPVSPFRLFLAVAFIVPALGAADTHGTAAKKDLMTRALDARLNRIKRSDPAEFKRERATQKDFSASTKEFCEFYRSHCQGSACPACVDNCYSSLYDFRAAQARKIGSKSLELGVPGDKPGTPYAEKFFKTFSENVCQLPASLWKSGNVPSNCPELQLKEMDSRLIAGFIASPESEGDVCAQLSPASVAATNTDVPARAGAQILMAPAVAPTIPVCAGEPALHAGRIKDLAAARADSLKQDPWLAWIAQISESMVSCKTSVSKKLSELQLNVKFGNGNSWSAAIQSGGALKWISIDFDKAWSRERAKAQAVRTTAAGLHGICTPTWDNPAPTVEYPFPPITLICKEQSNYSVMLQFNDEGQVGNFSITPVAVPASFESKYTSKNGLITVSFPPSFVAKTVGKNVVAVKRKTPGIEEEIVFLSIIPQNKELASFTRTLNAAEIPKIPGYIETSQKPAICTGQPGLENLGSWVSPQGLHFVRSSCTFLKGGRAYQFTYSVSLDLAPQDEPLLRKIRDAVRLNP